MKTCTYFCIEDAGIYSYTNLKSSFLSHPRIFQTRSVIISLIELGNVQNSGALVYCRLNK